LFVYHLFPRIAVSLYIDFPSLEVYDPNLPPTHENVAAFIVFFFLISFPYLSFLPCSPYTFHRRAYLHTDTPHTHRHTQTHTTPHTTHHTPYTTQPTHTDTCTHTHTRHVHTHTHTLTCTYKHTSFFTDCPLRFQPACGISPVQIAARQV
jgi:hypothetical protein